MNSEVEGAALDAADPHFRSQKSLPAALAERGLQRFVLGTASWGTAHQLSTLTQSYLVYDLTASSTYIAYLGASVGVPAVLLAGAGGMLADRVPRKLLWMAGSGIAALAMLIVTALYFADLLQPWHLLVAGIAQGTSLGLDWTARLSLLPTVVTRPAMVRAVVFDQVVFNSTRLIAPLIGGVVLATIGAGAAYVLMTGLFASTVTVVATLRPLVQERRETHPPVWAELGELASVVKQNSILGVNLLFTAVNATMLGGFVYLQPVFAADVFDVSETGLGFMVAAIGFGAVAGSTMMTLTGGVRKAGPGLVVSNLAFIAAAVAYASNTAYALALPLAFAIGLFNAVHVSLGIAAIQLNVSAEARGKMIGLYEIAWGGFSLGGLLLGAIAAAAGPGVSVIAVASATGAITLILWLFSRSLRDLRIER